MVGALALPLAAALSASAAPATVAAARACDQLGPWKSHASAVNIRSKASTKSTVLGVLYKSHKFTVHRQSGNWVYLTDKSTGVKGWVSGTYVYRDVRFCLD
jgi:uncharacterized protein YgiM (DUF1202 family)